MWDSSFDIKLLSKDLQKQKPASNISTISLNYYWEFIKTNPIQLKDALSSIIQANYLKGYDDYFLNKKNLKVNKPRKPTSKKGSKKQVNEDAEEIFDKNAFQGQLQDVKLTHLRALRLKRWADLAAIFHDTVDQLKQGKRKVNLKKFNNAKRSSWIKSFIKNERAVYLKNKQAQNPIKNATIDESEILKSDLEFLEEFLEVSEFSEDEDENDEKIFLLYFLLKDESEYCGTLDQQYDRADTIIFFIELLNEWIESEMPEEFNIIKQLKSGIKLFEEFHKEYRSFFIYQRDYVKFAKILLPIKASQPYFSTETVSKLIEKGKSEKLIFPLNNEISDLEFYINQYTEWIEQHRTDCQEVLEWLSEDTSFGSDPRCELATQILNQIKFLPLLSESDEEILIKIWCVSWMKKVDEIMNDIRKHPLNEWIQLTDEINAIEWESILSEYPLFEEFKSEYSTGYDIYNILNNKKTDNYRIYSNELNDVISHCRKWKIYLEDEIEELSHEVERFIKTEKLLLDMTKNREFLSKFNDLKQVFEDLPWIYKTELDLIEQINLCADKVKIKITEYFDEFSIIRRSQRGSIKEDSYNQKQSPGSLDKKNKNTEKANKNKYSVVNMAEKRKERINTIEESPPKKLDKRKSSKSISKSKDPKLSQNSNKISDKSQKIHTESKKSKLRNKENNKTISKEMNTTNSSNSDNEIESSIDESEYEPINSYENGNLKFFSLIKIKQ